MNKLRRRIWVRLCRICRRYKFRQICKAIEIAPYKWQRQYVLKDKPFASHLCDTRRTGKSTAVFLKLLMIDTPISPREVLLVLFQDPDFNLNNYRMFDWYLREYDKLAAMCQCRGIPIVRIKAAAMSYEYYTTRRML